MKNPRLVELIFALIKSQTFVGRETHTTWTPADNDLVRAALKEGSIKIMDDTAGDYKSTDLKVGDIKIATLTGEAPYRIWTADRFGICQLAASAA